MIDLTRRARAGFAAASAVMLLAATGVLAATASAAPPDPDAVEIAKGHVQQHRASLGLTSGDLADWVVSDRYATRHNGLTHVYLQQRLDGIEVVNGLINVNVSRSGQVVGPVGNRFVSQLAQSVNARTPSLTASEAAGRAANHLGLVGPEAEAREAVRLIYVPRPGGGVRLAWEVALEPDSDHYWHVAVDAVTGRVLEKHNLVVSDSYKVYALPAESPNHVLAPLPLPPADGRSIVSGAAADAAASPLGWHDVDGLAGADTTDTTGNNVFAQTDVDADDVFLPGGPDTRPSSPTRDFLPAIDLTLAPHTYQEAAVTNLFYWNNIIHDIHFRYGFDEPAGNFQVTNYSRQGLGTDPVRADAQDGSGTNNANMLTLPEGTPPRMQMFVWTGQTTLTVNSPRKIAGDYRAAPAAFGRQLDSTGVTGDLEVVNDGSENPSQGCNALVGFTAGRVAVIDRGGCEFGVKVKNAEDAGAIAAVVVNNQGDGLVIMAPGTRGGEVTIPSVFIGQSDGEKIKGTLATSKLVNATMRQTAVDRDSDLDNGVIIHEYGHGVSIRLTGGPSVTTCLFNDQQGGEGWSDWWALVLTQRAGADGTEPRGIGTYVLFEDPPDFGGGIRPFPYSTDMRVNPQTYGDLAEGTLSVPHGTGSVWATAIWEMHWALVNGVRELKIAGGGFRENLYDLSEPLAGNQVALRLVMDGLKLQKCLPTFLDARDAILQADQQDFGGVHTCAIWWAFAKRGMGVNADDGGDPLGDSLAVTEDFTLPASCAKPRGGRG
jgi:hypothetical protein